MAVSKLDKRMGSGVVADGNDRNGGRWFGEVGGGDDIS